MARDGNRIFNRVQSISINNNIFIMLDWSP